MQKAEGSIRRSVLDRLLQTGEPEPRTWSDSVRSLKAAVLRDVEWLLNTRRIIELAPAAFVELQQSVYHYGLPDVTSITADSPEQRRALLRQVEECLRLFEPRLANVRVSETEATAGSSRHVRFLVEGMLRLHPDPEPIAFDTVLEAGTGSFSVTGSG